MNSNANGSSNNDTRPKRKRLAKACDACHKSKRRCDGVSPCSNCYFASKACTYTDNNGRPVPAPRVVPEHPQSTSQSQSQQKPDYPSMPKRSRQGGPSRASTSLPGDQSSNIPMVELDASLTRELTNLYFTHCHPVVAIVHRPSFTNALSLNQVPSFLLLAMCALAARFSKRPSLREVPERLSGRAFARKAAREMFDDDDGVGNLIVQPTFQAAQALCILSIWEIIAMDHSPQPVSPGSKGKEPGHMQWAKGERYRDLCLQMVQKLGAYDPEEPSHISATPESLIEASLERESIRRTFWLVYTVDLLRGTYYRWEEIKRGNSGIGYLNSRADSNPGTSTHSTFGGPATTTSRQTEPEASLQTFSSALCLGEGVHGYSENELKLRLPVDETSFELGNILDKLPEYLHIPAVCSSDASELAHAIRIMTIHHKVEQCLAEDMKCRLCIIPSIDPSSSRFQPPSHTHSLSDIVEPNDRFSRQSFHPPSSYKGSLKHLDTIHRLLELERILDEWAESLPEPLRFTDTNLKVHKSMFETSSSTGAWSFMCIHAVYASTALALAVAFRGVQYKAEPQGTRKPGERSTDRNDLTWAVERLHILLDLMGERAKHSMILGSAIWPLMRYVHQDDDEMKNWEDVYENYTGVRMADLAGSKWVGEPVFGPNDADIFRKGLTSRSFPATSDHGFTSNATISEPILPHPLLDTNFGIAPGLISKLSHPTSNHAIPSSQSQPYNTSLPSLKSSGLLEWQGLPRPIPSSGQVQPQSTTSLVSMQAQTQNQQPTNEVSHGRVGLSWMMNG